MMKKTLSIVGVLSLVLLLPVALFVLGQQTGFENRAGDANQISAPGFIADSAFVDAETPTKNYGASSTLWADGESIKIAYIKFNLTELAGKEVKSAVLKLFVTHTSAGVQEIKVVSVSAWTGDTITYSVRPLVGDELVTTFDGGAAGAWVEVNLTDFVRANAGQVVSVAISSDDPNGLAFNSSKAPFDKMELIIEE